MGGSVCKVIAVSEAGRPVGSDSPRAVWTDETVERLRAAVENGQTIADAARTLGMPYDTARDIIRGRRRGVLPARWVVVRADGRRRVLCG